MKHTFAFVCMLSTVAGCREPLAIPAPEPPVVTITTPVQGDVPIFQYSTGRTSAVERAEIRARVQGTLEQIHFKDSADVTKGQSLFTIEQEPYKAALQRATATLESRQAELKLANANYARGKKLIDKNAISQQDLDVMIAEVSQAKAAISGAESLVADAELKLGYTSVTSPIDGRIDRNLVDVGNLVGAGDNTLLAIVVRLDPIQAYFDVDESTYLQILDAGGGKRREQSERPPIYLARQNDEGFPFEGEIDFIDNEVDPNTGTILARGTFPNPDLLIMPGMFVRLRIQSELREDAVLVEEDAIGTDMQGKYVLVVDDENIVARQGVELGTLENGRRVIESGLAPDARYVVEGIQKARPGLPVRPESKTPGAPPPSSENS